jgi:hypothetical protein
MISDFIFTLQITNIKKKGTIRIDGYFFIRTSTQKKNKLIN